MTLPVLYSFRRCPFAMRARMALVVSRQSVELREVALKDKPAEMLAASPKGTVPVLALPDGRVIEESLLIMLWALGISDPDGWLEPDLVSQKALIAACDGPFKHHLDRYKYAARYDGANASLHRGVGMAFLIDLDDRLGGGFLFGDAPVLADIAISPFVRQFRIADPDWFDAEAPAGVVRWLRRGIDSGVFAASMGKFVPWRPGDEAVIFPA